MGGGVADYMAGVAGVFQASGNIPAALDSYAGAVDAEPLRAATAN
jgi:taurine transport system substrate-binding protein